jgi:hypothetical protein
MNSQTDYTQIEYEIANISRIINNEQKYISEISSLRINNVYQLDDFIKAKQLNLIRLIKQKIELENKLQKAHEERYKEFEQSNAFTGVTDVMKMAFQYAHPIDKRTKRYSVDTQAERRARSHSPRRNRDVARPYKKDRFEMFLNFLTVNLKILRFICVIAFVIIQFVYIFAFIYTKLFGSLGSTKVIA